MADPKSPDLKVPASSVAPSRVRQPTILSNGVVVPASVREGAGSATLILSNVVPSTGRVDGSSPVTVGVSAKALSPSAPSNPISPVVVSTGNPAATILLSHPSSTGSPLTSAFSPIVAGTPTRVVAPGVITGEHVERPGRTLTPAAPAQTTVPARTLVPGDFGTARGTIPAFAAPAAVPAGGQYSAVPGGQVRLTEPGFSVPAPARVQHQPGSELTRATVPAFGSGGVDEPQDERSRSGTPLQSTPALPVRVPTQVEPPLAEASGTGAPSDKASAVAATAERGPVGATTTQGVTAQILASPFVLQGAINTQLPVLQAGNSGRALAFRALRQRLAEQDDPRVLLVTSARDEEGKTTCAANLALVLAGAGRQVLLVEASLRRPQLARIFGFPPSHCLLSQLQAHREQKKAPWHTTAIQPVGLHVMAVAPDMNRDAAIHGPTFSSAMVRWRRAFDYVVVDGPSLLSSCDAAIIQDYVDRVVVVVQAVATRNGHLQHALEQISASKLAGLVLMDSPSSPYDEAEI
jgi:Mrp family chromosome partitioning ATPase